MSHPGEELVSYLRWIEDRVSEEVRIRALHSTSSIMGETKQVQCLNVQKQNSKQVLVVAGFIQEW